jgi:hypothetical protein
MVRYNICAYIMIYKYIFYTQINTALISSTMCYIKFQILLKCLIFFTNNDRDVVTKSEDMKMMFLNFLLRQK